jgi:hypothetical protein
MFFCVWLLTKIYVFSLETLTQLPETTWMTSLLPELGEKNISLTFTTFFGFQFHLSTLKQDKLHPSSKIGHITTLSGLCQCRLGRCGYGTCNSKCSLVGSAFKCIACVRCILYFLYLLGVSCIFAPCTCTIYVAFGPLIM